MNPNDCKLLEGYLNGSLDAQNEDLFRRHLENCSKCTSEVALWNSFRNDLKDAFASLAPAETMTLPQVAVEKQLAQKQQLPASLAVAATVLLAVTISLVLLLSSSGTAPTDTATAGSRIEPRVQVVDLRGKTVPVVAKAKFAPDTIAVLENDDDEFTFYRVFPKLTSRSELP